MWESHHGRLLRSLTLGVVLAGRLIIAALLIALSSRRLNTSTYLLRIIMEFSAYFVCVINLFNFPYSLNTILSYILK